MLCVASLSLSFLTWKMGIVTPFIMRFTVIMGVSKHDFRIKLDTGERNHSFKSRPQPPQVSQRAVAFKSLQFPSLLTWPPSPF